MPVKKIAIISLSRGLLGESFIQHEEDIGMRRLWSYGIEVVTTANSRNGIDFLQYHPEARAQDLLDAFSAPSIDMILCAIGGDDTYRLLPYLFEHKLISEIGKPDMPIVYNVNIGHATPRCIIPLGVEAMVDAKKQIIRFV